MATLHFIRDNLRFLSAGVVLLLSSCPGQTFFISIFAAQIMAEFSLSDGDWGLVYTLATSASAVALFWAGALTDRFRVRLLAVIVMPGLALSCIAMGINTSLIGLVLIVFLLRFFGQGMMYQLAATAMARWFVGRRGLALSISSMGFMFGQAFYPIIFASLLTVFDWRTLWGIAAALVLIAFPVILRLLTLERQPVAHAETHSSSGMDGRHWTRAEVMRSPFFLMLLPMLLGPPAWGTSLFFQQVHIANVKGWLLVDYLALVPLMTIVSVVVTLTSGSFIDRFGSGRAMQFFMLPWIVAFALLAQTNSLTVAAFAFVVFGLATGLQATLITAFWAEFFGTRHIGAIKAASTSIMVFGSAIGPGISGLLIDWGYSFPDQMFVIAAYFSIAMLLVWIAVELALPRLANAT